MNKNLFESKMKLHGETVATLSQVLNIAPSTLIKRKNGQSQWVQGEISILKNHWNLTADEIDEIFFNIKVS